jgi:hypothetical protein
MKRVFLLAALISCGDLSNNEPYQCDPGTYAHPDTGKCTRPGMTPIQTNSDPSPAKETFKLRGSVTSAFEVVVNGVEYPDLEAFYSEEVLRLREYAKQNGIAAELEAVMGMDDFHQKMTIFVSSSDKRGYQSKASSNSDGSFEVSFPIEAKNDTFKLKANKRIAVTLIENNKRNKICYNFSAVEANVSFADESSPIILNEFVSTVTNYECTDEATGSLQLPSSTPQVSPSPSPSASPALLSPSPRPSSSPSPTSSPSPKK